MTQITEVAPDLYRISTYVAKANFQFNQFLILDDEPLLYHTGTSSLFTNVQEVRDAVAKVIAPEKIRWIGFSHFEADECGSLTQPRSAALRPRSPVSMTWSRTARPGGLQMATVSSQGNTASSSS